MGKLTRECYVNGLKTIFRKNYKVEVDLFDWEAEIDYKLTYGENFYIVHEKLRKRGILRWRY